MKVKITELADELGVNVNDLMLLKAKKLTPEDYTGHGKNTWFTESAVVKIRLAWTYRSFLQMSCKRITFTMLPTRVGFMETYKALVVNVPF
jgi:hypothetical protein